MKITKTELVIGLIAVGMILFGAIRPCFADDYIVLWLNRSASASDKIKVRDGLYTLLNDKSKIDATTLPQWRVVANPSIIGWVCVINFENPKRLKANLENLTLAKLIQWRDNNLDNPNHLRWDRGADWEQMLKDAGLEPVPEQ